jgi:hypothetical protein
MIWVGRLISFAIVLQSLELFWVKPWDWQAMKSEAPKVLRGILAYYDWILGFRLAMGLAALIFPHPVVIAFLAITSWLISVRWRGTFNGGSDAMTMQILLAWFVSMALPNMAFGCLLYILIQLLLSYVVAGLSKLANPDWRDGVALRYFLKSSGYSISPTASLVLSWILILFECSFPLAVFFPRPFLMLGLLFHIGNFLAFGLNRFFFVWLAAYPALLFQMT